MIRSIFSLPDDQDSPKVIGFKLAKKLSVDCEDI